MSSTPVLNVQEPPFQQPFLDDKGLVDPIWQLWLISIFTTQNGQNAGIGAAATVASVTAETTRAEAAETGLGSAIAVESARAQAAEAANAAAVTAETGRAEAAEALLAPVASPTFSGTVTEPVAVLTGATPSVAAGQLGLGKTTTATATSGAATLPGNPLGFLSMNLAGTIIKVPYYSA